MKNVIFILTCFLIAPCLVLAQAEPQPLWELSQTVVSDQLGIEFDAPAGWTVFRDEVHFAVYILQDNEDLNALTDLSTTTVPRQPMISLNALRMDDQTRALPLDEIASSQAQNVGMTILDSQVISVLARPALQLIVRHEETQRSRALALWRENNIVFAFALTLVGEEISEEVSYTWELILDSVRPAETLELTETASIPFLAYSIDYPSSWYVRVEQRSGFNSLNISQFSGEEVDEGYQIVVWTTLMEASEQTDEQVAQRLADVFHLTLNANSPIEEFRLLDQRGIGMGWTSRTGETTYGILVPHTPFPELETYYLITAPTQELLNEFWTTWIAMLQSVRLIE